MSKAGNPRARQKAIELAWLWVRHQPGSALTEWFLARTANASKRVKRISIVALARKLMVALWCYLRTGLDSGGGGDHRIIDLSTKTRVALTAIAGGQSAGWMDDRATLGQQQSPFCRWVPSPRGFLYSPQASGRARVRSKALRPDMR